ncbi:MAG: TerB family tellurite resistance protein [Bacteroidetes bacterium]|nr:TerB family tellurite resistance protein [Bacteroidota bacterium]
MAEFNYKQIIYAGMVAIAGVDGTVDKTERNLVDKVFDHDFNMSRSERKEVIRMWEGNKEGFTDQIIAELALFPKFDQREAFKRISQFILFKSNMYNKSMRKFGKGVDAEKDQINRYRERADIIRKGLSF